MNTRSFSFLVTLLMGLLVLGQSDGLQRDFTYSRNGKNFQSNEICLNYLKNNDILPDHLDLSVIPVLKKNQKCTAVCPGCDKPSQVYVGYFIFQYQNGYPFLQKQIAYAKKYPNYQAYWPETSTKAENINELAVKLFKNLFEKTALKKTTNLIPLLRDYIVDSATLSLEDLSLHLPIASIAQCFRFSDYFVVCKDIGEFARKHAKKEKFFTKKEYWKIESAPQVHKEGGSCHELKLCA